jgi:nucleoside-diphosphate-sugar epimerase
MGTRQATTAFVTNPEGFVGAELVSTLVARGIQVLALTPSPEAAARVRQAGATAVMGRLLTPGRWQDEVAADWVFHLPPPFDSHIGSTRPDLTRARVSIDRNVFDAVAAGSARRIVYVANLSRNPAMNARPITEDELPAPCGAGSWRTSTLDCLEGYVLAGLPIVTGIPGCIYGNGEWFRQVIVEPIMAGQRVWLVGQASRCVSPIHVRDCARALVHLAERAERGRRYFIANTEPTRIDELAATFARVAGRRLRVWSLPAAARVVVGRRRAVCAGSDIVLSNIRLRGTGFQFEYPTVEEGCRQILRTFHG